MASCRVTAVGAVQCEQSPTVLYAEASIVLSDLASAGPSSPGRWPRASRANCAAEGLAASLPSQVYWTRRFCFLSPPSGSRARPSASCGPGSQCSGRPHRPLLCPVLCPSLSLVLFRRTNGRWQSCSFSHRTTPSQDTFFFTDFKLKFRVHGFEKKSFMTVKLFCCIFRFFKYVDNSVYILRSSVVSYN